MRKYNKNIGIILSGVVIATSTQITTLSHALEPNTIQTTLEKNIEENISKTSDYKKSEVIAVTNEKELIEALENENIKTVEIKNDIAMTGSFLSGFDIDIRGNEKEIKGNGYTISNGEGSSNWFTLYANTKIDNLKLRGGQIFVEEKKLEIVNNSELNGFSIALDGNESLGGDVSLENVKLNGTSIHGKGNLVVNSSKLKNSHISVRADKEKIGIAKIINTEINGKGYGDAPIDLDGGSVELENIKITNPGDHAIYAKGSKESGGKVRVKGTLEIDGAKKDAIVLKKGDNSSTENPLELYIDGDIKQKGDTYTIKAEEGPYTKIYYNESKIKKVIDKWSHVYYSTKNREGNEPESIVYSNKLVGENRYKTAVKVSNEGWDSAYRAVLVNSNSIADALSATPFAESEHAPILLTEANKLNSETKKELSRLGTGIVYVIGGESVVSNSVINELKSMNITVERISGKDRYETSLEIAKKRDYASEIAVVNGVTGLPDAVSIAPVAADKRIPIVLASPKEGTKVFDQYIKDKNIKKSYIIGSDAAISNEIANKLPNPERLGGINRNETNVAILEKFYTSEELNNIFVAKDGMKNQNDLVDALAVGVLAAKEKSPVVIVENNLNDKQESLLSKKQPKGITQVGGNGNENAFNKLVNMFKN
ncbi:cell wall-binding repeat-containing protein [Clostridium sp. CCUG 7971]|uniref:cell wall-binding repeat-containing protein n=1 Tax=Clostridium sp. CCUG 7971 TaxID=2811414 RepID=UPI001ABAB031|nr:cell wall-binding repeat-containing protein [Clostridium sp. CCUG 7971]MBO3443201.1 cell wall-binding repeat-containing protein [Clostridium sp. CCUG 7971]